MLPTAANHPGNGGDGGAVERKGEEVGVESSLNANGNDGDKSSLTHPP